MKLSQMKTDEHFDVFCELIDTVDDIFSDTKFMLEVQKLIQQLRPSKDNVTNKQLMTFLWKKKNIIINLLLKIKREETFKIISIINDKPIEKIKKQLLIQTIWDCKQVFSDKDLIDFFKSQLEQEQKEAS